MRTLWPSRTAGDRIQDVQAPKLAEAAFRSIQKSGRTAYALRLLYRALELDPSEPNALLVLVDLFRGKKYGARPVGDEIYAGILVEYAMDPHCTMSIEHKRFFDKARSEIMLLWGFVTPKGDEIDMDYIGYMTYINKLLNQALSIANGFRVALAKVGIQAGAIDATSFKPTRTYQDWLQAPATILH